MKNYILVTGGLGFVGFNLVKKLVEIGEKVIVIDNLYNSKPKDLDNEVIFFELDISEESNLKNLDKYKIDIIFHLAAQSSNATSFIDPIVDLKFNQIGTFNLLNYCSKKNIQRFIYTSSMSIYGKIDNYPTPEFNEKKPDSFYAIHKLAGEYYCEIFKSYMGIDYTIFRLYSVYGFGQNTDNLDQGLLSIYLGYILKKEKLIVKGSPERMRDMIHVDDVTEALIMSIKNKKSFNKIYNLGFGKSIKVKEIIKILLNTFSKNNFPVIFESQTKGDPFKTEANIELLKKDFNWNPLIKPEDGIKQTAQKYLKISN